MPINFDPNSLNSVFDKNFGAGAYNAGLSNAQKAAQLKTQASFAKTNYLKRLSDYQTKLKQDQTYMDKYGMTKDQYDAQQAQKKANSTFDSALNYWSDKTKDLKNNGAYKTANDLVNNPQAVEDLKNQGYDINKIIDAAYQVASNGKFSSKNSYDQYATELDKSNTDKKKNQDSIDLYYQKALAQEQQKNVPQQQSFADKAKALALGAMDLIDRPGNAVRTGIKDAMSGKGFLQGAKEGLLGQDHTSGVQLLQNAGLDPNNNPIAKSLLNGVATGLQMNPSSRTFFGMAGKGDNRGQKTAGLATEIALDPLSYLGARVPKVKPGVSTAEDLLRLGAPRDRLGLPAPAQRLGLPGTDSTLSLPSPQLRLNEPVREPLGLPAPQLQLEAPKPIQSSLDTLLNAGKRPSGLQSPIPQMPTAIRSAQLKNAGAGFGYNTKLEPKTRGIISGSMPRYAKDALSNQADTILNDVSNIQNKPANFYSDRLLQVQHDMQKNLQTTKQYQDEFKNAVQQQYQYLKNSMGKGVSRGTTSNGLDGNFKQVTGRFNVSNNPKWYQDFYKQYGRKPNNKELMQLAEHQVKNGFADQFGNLPAYMPKKIEDINNQLDEISTILDQHPEQQHVLSPIVQALEQERQMVLSDYQKAINGSLPNVDQLYSSARSANDPATFDHLVRMNQLETNAQKPTVKMQVHGPFQAPAGPKISRPATLDEMVQRLQGMAPPKQTVQEPLPLNFKKEIVAKANRGQEPPLQFKKTIPNPALQAKKDVSNSPLFLNPNSLKAENVLKTTSTSKTLDQMTKDELQTVYKQLQDKKASLTGKKASKRQMKAVEDDLKKVNQFLMDSNLQMFGKNAAKKKPTTGETITPRERKAQKQAVANFTDQAKKVGLDPSVRKAIQKTENVGAMLKGAKNINEIAAKLPKEMGNQVKQSLKMVDELKKTKDILPTQTLTKNVYELADRLPKSMGNKIKAELDQAKAAHVNNMEQRSNDLYNKIVKGLGIEKGSKESALVQDFGEKTLGKKYLRSRGIDPNKLSQQELETVNLQQLKKLHPNDWQKIVKADEYLRNDYKKIIGEVNATVKKIYPTTYEKHMVKERSDYFHHFQELNGFEGFKNMVESSSAIDPHLAGISSYTQPKSKWQGFKQERKNGSYKSDAIGGYLRYLQASSYSTHIDPVIKTLRDTADQIAEATKDTRNMNNIKSAIVAQADNLAGKTNPIDRLFQDHIVGRKIMNVANVINGHIKKNMILGNLGSALGQIGNVPLAVGKAKQFAAQGAMDTLKYAATHLPGTSKAVSEPLNQSKFLKERYSNQLFTRFDTGLLKKPEKMAAWLIETADKSGTYFTWNSMYRKGLAQGVADPIKYADTETRHIVAGRGVGEIPVAQKAKITQLIAPFSLEVGNQWKVLGKQVTEKDFAGIITFLAASYGLNVAMNHTKGSDASYNPIGAIVAGINKDQTATTGEKAKSALANLLGETVGNIPGGNYIPQVLGLINQQQKQAVFGDRSPDRFGTGLGVGSTIFKPATDLVGGKGVEQFSKDLLPLVAPLGGNQARKTWNGIEALAKGGAYNNQGKLQYPVDASNPSDLLHSLMFGQTTTTQGRDYYNKNQQPLSANQTTTYQNAPNKQDYFNNIQSQRQVKAIQKKIQDIQKDSSMSPDEKLKSIFALTQLLQNTQK